MEFWSYCPFLKIFSKSPKLLIAKARKVLQLVQYKYQNISFFWSDLIILVQSIYIKWPDHLSKIVRLFILKGLTICIKGSDHLYKEVRPFMLNGLTIYVKRSDKIVGRTALLCHTVCIKKNCIPR